MLQFAMWKLGLRVGERSSIIPIYGLFFYHQLYDSKTATRQRLITTDFKYNHVLSQIVKLRTYQFSGASSGY